MAVMRALALVHSDDLETGTVGEHLIARGFDLSVATAHDDLPEPSTLDVIVVYGSSAAAYDDTVPWLARELDFLRAGVAARTPILGICFGGQALARVLGGTVAPSPVPEIGWSQVASREPGLVASGPWLEFHYDRFTVPKGGIEVARTATAIQAFTYGPHLGVQFHPEISETMFARWLESWQVNGEIEAIEAHGVSLEAIALDLKERSDALRSQAAQLFDAFFERAQRVVRARAVAQRV